MARKPKPNDKLTSWRIVLIRKKGERVGTVAAADAEAAIAKAIATFSIEPRYHKRLVAVRIEDEK